MNAGLAQFDRDVTLVELLRAIPRAKIESALNKSLGNAWNLADGDAVALAGPQALDASTAIAVPLTVEIETIGKLTASGVRREQVEAATSWLEIALASAYRYQMAASLHLQAVNADYEALQQQNRALKESESRFRELAEQLDQRVKEQVAQIERAQRQVFQAEKMASIGSLSAGMAHEINNPIGFIRSNLNTASLYFDKLRQALAACRQGPEALDAAWQKHDIDFVIADFPGLLDESVAGADRIARIIAHLKAYASVEYAPSSAVSLNDAVRAAAGVIGDQLPENIAIELDLQALPDIAGDQSHMNQVLFALLQNARQALPEKGGVIRISSRLVNDEIRVAVSDNGCGIPADVLSRIFDPFFTTRDVGNGMGLGLTVCHDIVTAHGGKIEVATTMGSGSTFTMRLPAAQTAALPDACGSSA